MLIMFGYGQNVKVAINTSGRLSDAYQRVSMCISQNRVISSVEKVLMFELSTQLYRVDS